MKLKSFPLVILFFISTFFVNSASSQYRNHILDHIDGDFFEEQTLKENIEKWLDHAVTDNGFLINKFTYDWRPTKPLHSDLTSQARIVYALSIGYQITNKSKYRKALINSTNFMIKKFRDTKYGGFYDKVDEEGNVISKSKVSYSHIFALWGLTHAYKVTNKSWYLKVALNTAKVIEKKFKDKHGGIVWSMDRKFTKIKGTNTFNTLMHYLEALLYLYDETRLPEVKDYINKALAFMESKFNIERGYIPENFDSKWNELTRGSKAVVNIGHHLEWAFFLQYATELGFPVKYLTIGEAALNFAMEYGYDYETGLFPTRFIRYDDFSKLNDVKHWCQTEGLRTLATYASKRGRSDLWEYYDLSLKYVKDNFIDHKYGSWFSSPGKENGAKSDAYHITTMNTEMLRLTGRLDD